MNYLLIILAGIFVNNCILSQFLGICPFLGVSKKVESAAGMGVAVIFVIVLACAATYFIYNLILVPLGIDYLYNIEATSADATKEFERVARIDENVVRHLVLKLED